MCFSPEASFIASGVLGLSGVASIKIAETTGDRFLGGIPLLFGLHQAIEGIVWLSLEEVLSPQIGMMAIYSFAIIATVWPTYFSIVQYSREKGRERRNALLLMLILGTVVTSYLMFHMVTQELNARIVEHCIRYEGVLPYEEQVRNVYLVIVVGAFIISRYKILRWMGGVFIIGFTISIVSYNYAYASVWCFFSALISGFVYAHLKFERALEE